jgi:hypothetical protein
MVVAASKLLACRRRVTAGGRASRSISLPSAIAPRVARLLAAARDGNDRSAGGAGD